MATIWYKMGHLEIWPNRATPGASSNVIDCQTAEGGQFSVLDCCENPFPVIGSPSQSLATR